MAPIVEVVTGLEKDEEVFVSLEHTPILLAQVRKNLLHLKSELSKKWSVEEVRIENRIPRLRNPYDALQIIEAACVGLLVSFTLPAVKAAGKKVGVAIGDEIADRVRRWIRINCKPSPTRSRSLRRARKKRSRRNVKRGAKDLVD
jgi:hypothetical protein